jgi:hypothetical protein
MLEVSAKANLIRFSLRKSCKLFVLLILCKTQVVHNFSLFQVVIMRTLS